MAGWFLSAPATREYERTLVPVFFRPFSEELVTRAALGSGQRVLDLACGTGIVARTAARSIGTEHVFGVDSNEAMIAVARETEPAIDWREANASQLPFADASFDAVLCQQGLQFFPDRLRCLRETRRVLARGGAVHLLCFAAIDENPYFAALASAFERHVGAAPAAIVMQGFEIGTANDLETLLTDSGFSRVAIERVRTETTLPSIEPFVRRHLAALPFTDVLDELDPEHRQRMVDELADRLKRYESTGGLPLPSVNYYARADLSA